jgi:3-oxoacyl-[acyl-carrier protein] reductase
VVSSLSGRRAIVTGAASGIGRAAALALTEAGASVIGLDLAEGAGEVTIIRTDVSSETDVDRAVDEAAARLGGGIDIAVNSAGIELDSPLRALDIAALDRMYAVNVRGTALVARAALRHMRPGGRIINIASELAYLGRGGASGYCATKGAILSLTRSWARELAPDILVNAVAPGPVDTPLLGFEKMTEAQREMELDNPLRRIGRPEEVAAAIVFLAGPGASFITGQCIGVDGGAAMR